MGERLCATYTDVDSPRLGVLDRIRDGPCTAALWAARRNTTLADVAARNAARWIRCGLGDTRVLRQRAASCVEDRVVPALALLAAARRSRRYARSPVFTSSRHAHRVAQTGQVGRESRSTCGKAPLSLADPAATTRRPTCDAPAGRRALRFAFQAASDTATGTTSTLELAPTQAGWSALAASRAGRRDVYSM